MNIDKKKENGNHFRTPPQNIDAEKALLGSIMLRPVSLLEIIDSISEDDFYVQKHKLIYRSMIELSRIGDPIDLVSVAEKLQAMNLLDQSGGISYLNDVANTVPNATNIEYYAKIVSGKSVLRKLIVAGDFVTQLGFEESNFLFSL